MAKSHCTCTCIKSSKEFAWCVWKTLQDCISVYMLWRFEIWENQFYLHSHSCLMGTITFEVNPITPTSPRRHACNHISILILFAFIFFAKFSFVKYIMHGHIRERKEIPNYVKLLTLHFCYAEVYIYHFMIGGQQW